MNKHRMTPFFALTKTPNLNVGESDDLETHLAEILAVEALSAAMAGSNEAPRSSWRTSVTKRLDGPAPCISCCSRREIGGCSIFYSKNSLRRIFPRARPSFIAGVFFVVDDPSQLCLNR